MSPEQKLAFSLALAQVTLGYVAYFFVSHSIKQKNKIFKKPEAIAWVEWVVFQRVTGMFFLGLIPLLTSWIVLGKSPLEYGLGLGRTFYSLVWILGLGIIIITINFFNARKPDSLEMYPQIRTKRWTNQIFFLNAITWIGYLFAYEFLFRGILLFDTLSIGLIPAIVLNAAIYSLAHIPKGIKETIGSIPLGALLSYLTFESGTIWIAFFVHITLALSNDIFSLYFHPKIHYKKK